jgi:5-(carboxyamino)imidazole ribonucleotide mutase
MAKNKGPLVSIVMGSDSDLDIMRESIAVLEDFNVPFEVFLTSAHRSPERTSAFSRSASDRGIKVIIAGAGAAAHLAGVIASQTTLPVIGVPISATSLNGLDALLSTVQMPGGVPVATMALGKAGAKNAAIMAIRILALHNETLQQKLDVFIENLAADVAGKQDKLEWRKS